MGNIVNRVFDSSGPEGKVRGTPQQIIDKYLQLTRDAQLGNDRVAAENFQQHAEHYARMLGEAQREIEARREQHEQQSGRNNGHPSNGAAPLNGRDGDGSAAAEGERRGPSSQGFGDQPDVSAPPTPAPESVADPEPDVPKRSVSDADVIDFPRDEVDAGGTGLVETPESAPKSKRGRGRSRNRSDARPEDAPPAVAPEEAAPDAAPPASEPVEAAEAPAPKPARKSAAAKQAPGPEAATAEPEATAEAAPAKPRRRTRAKPKPPKTEEAEQKASESAEAAPAPDPAPASDAPSSDSKAADAAE
ncbi:MAG: DUF4167 domain-containing protein [Planctomycetota bacterium]